MEGGAAVLLYLENVVENLKDPARAVRTKCFGLGGRKARARRDGDSML